MTDSKQIPERHPRAVQKRVGEALAAGTVVITRSVEETYAQVMALRLAGLDTNEAVKVLNRALREYDCQVGAYGREHLLKQLALVHVTFGPETCDIDTEGAAADG